MSKQKHVVVLCSVRQATLLCCAGKGGSWQYWTAQGLRSCLALLVTSCVCMQIGSVQPCSLGGGSATPKCCQDRQSPPARGVAWALSSFPLALCCVQIRAARHASHEEAMRLTCGGRELADGESAGGITGVVLCLLFDRSLAARGSKRACEEPAQCVLDRLPADWVRAALWQVPALLATSCCCCLIFRRGLAMAGTLGACAACRARTRVLGVRSGVSRGGRWVCRWTRRTRLWCWAGRSASC